MYWGCWLKISSSLSPKIKWQKVNFLTGWRSTEVEYVAVKIKYFIIVSYNSTFCLVNVQALAVYLANAPTQLSWEGILGKPKEVIENLNGFEYMYLSNLKVPYFFYSSSISIKVFSMGTTLFPSMTRLPLPLTNKQKLDPKRLHLELTWMWGGEKGSEVKSENLDTIYAKNCLHRGMWNGSKIGQNSVYVDALSNPFTQ